MSRPPLRLDLDQVPAPVSSPSSPTSASTSREFFWTNSRSFSFASLGFKHEDRKLVEYVYAFCRITDDIVDEAGDASPKEIGERLDAWLETARRAYDGVETEPGWLNELMRRSASREVPFQIVETLISGVRTDATLTSVDSIEDLKSYCFGVASVVGLWLCHLFDVTEPWYHRRAEALGRGMQLTNIIRDVGEDLRRGRLYLPTDLMREHGVERRDLETALSNGKIPAGYAALMDRLIHLADEDYDLAWEAIPLLPGGFDRASAVAAEVYRAIHHRVVANDYDNLTKRGRTRTPDKVLLMSRALLRLWLARFNIALSGPRQVGPTTGLITLPFLTL